MGKTLASMTGAVMISVAFTLPTFAQNYSPGSNQNQPSQPTQMQDQPTQMNQGTGVPNVSSLTPFGAETNYMSLAGYLRYVSYGQTGQWLTRAEATRIVTQHKGSSPRQIDGGRRACQPPSVLMSGSFLTPDMPVRPAPTAPPPRLATAYADARND